MYLHVHIRSRAKVVEVFLNGRLLFSASTMSMGCPCLGPEPWALVVLPETVIKTGEKQVVEVHWQSCNEDFAKEEGDTVSAATNMHT